MHTVILESWLSIVRHILMQQLNNCQGTVYVHIPLWRCEILKFPGWDYRVCWKKKYHLSIRTPNDQMDRILNNQFPMQKTATGILCFLAEFSYYEGHLLKVQTRLTRSRGIRNPCGFQWDRHFTLNARVPGTEASNPTNPFVAMGK